MPGVHRTQRMPVDELQGVLLNLVVWRTEHDHRAREVTVQQRKQALLITAACARCPHQRAPETSILVRTTGRHRHCSPSASHSRRNGTGALVVNVPVTAGDSW
ncbi:MAG TPA: hypothetical protein VKA66_22865 [Mycobacterium sp.]|nr:hypothetical protein [Mycobacterium sp.]HKI43145.1 hypothetical protein [Mycobacterium sp.]